MSEYRNLFNEIDIIKEKIIANNSNSRTLDDDIRENNPNLINFILKANRVWRYNGDKSQFTRKIRNIRNKRLTILISLILQLLVSFFILRFNYGWILFSFNILWIGPYIYYIVLNLKSNLNYEIKNADYCKAPLYKNFYDDNGILYTRENVILIKIVKILSLSTIFQSVYLFVSILSLKIESTFIAVGYISVIIQFLIYFVFMYCLTLSDPKYYLYFVDDKNDIEYLWIKDFMNKNSIK